MTMEWYKHKVIIIGPFANPAGKGLNYKYQSNDKNSLQ